MTYSLQEFVKDEYRSRTDIKTVEEAQSKLLHLRVLFVVVLGASITLCFIPKSDDPSVWLSISLAYTALLLFFVFYCRKIIKLTADVTKAELVWSLLLAPVSWFWFYPAIVEPLKIITGKAPVPNDLPSVGERTSSRNRVNKMYWDSMKLLGWVLGLWSVAFLIFLFWVLK